MRRQNNVTRLVLPAALILAGCVPGGEVEVPLTLTTGTPIQAATATPSPPPPAPKTLIVCLRSEPTSLYLYGDQSPEAAAVRQALYDGPVDLVDYQFQPVAIEKLPGFEDGDARVETISVGSGEVVLHPDTLRPQNLRVGQTYLPAGCRSADCLRTFWGGQVEMDRLVVEFELREGLTWSDGTPVTAGDSLFSFQLDADRDTPTSKYMIDRTAEYLALGEKRLRWVGIAGFLDLEYQGNVWTPLPQHLLGELSAAEILASTLASRTPIGYGAYQVAGWESGVAITLHPNPHYFRSQEGLPAFDALLFRFIGGDVREASAQLLSGECDVLDESVLRGAELRAVVAQAQSGNIQLLSAPGVIVERLDFNLDSLGSGPLRSSLRDIRLRRAIRHCIDGGGLLDQSLEGLGAVADSYLPPMHPGYLAAPDGTGFDPQAGIALLEQYGWLDQDGDPATPRTSAGVAGVSVGTPLILSYLAADTPLQQAVSSALERQLGACGVGLQIDLLPAAELYATWPDGPVFGRTFELVGWGWPAGISPPCDMFLGAEVPGAGHGLGINASGYREEPYDRACRAAQLSGPQDDSVWQATFQTQAVLVDRVPTIPLLVLPRLLAAAPHICGLRINSTSGSMLWAVEEFDAGEACGPPAGS
jgi:peptide/nickel transport system substrate-binding protein